MAYSNSNVSLSRKALVYAICFDIAKTALSMIGSTNEADKTKVSMVVYDTVTAAAKAKSGK